MSDETMLVRVTQITMVREGKVLHAWLTTPSGEVGLAGEAIFEGNKTTLELSCNLQIRVVKPK